LNPFDLPREAQLVFVSAIGLFVGSFLNVAIHRLPLEGQSVSHPRRSQCPNCKRVLTWTENVPLLSWILQRGRCRGCRWPIPWRYPMVELLTALLWLLVAAETLPVAGDLGLTASASASASASDWGLVAVRLLIVSGLIVATFVDFAHFEIPDEISIGGIVAAPILTLILPRIHADDSLARYFSEGPGIDRVGALIGCAIGMSVGAGILLGIGWLGKLVFRRDAMGLGDVKLLAAAGGFIGAAGVFFALIVGSLAASVAGIVNMARMFAISRARVRSRGATKSVARSLQSARIAGRYIPFGPYLAIGIGIVLLYWNDVPSWI
jgi:leader peptidase (prepilin peptidase)/N-methyltransferase